jgi:hypothetical protein
VQEHLAPAPLLGASIADFFVGDGPGPKGRAVSNLFDNALRYPAHIDIMHCDL